MLVVCSSSLASSLTVSGAVLRPPPSCNYCADGGQVMLVVCLNLAQPVLVPLVQLLLLSISGAGGGRCGARVQLPRPHHYAAGRCASLQDPSCQHQSSQVLYVRFAATRRVLQESRANLERACRTIDACARQQAEKAAAAASAGTSDKAAAQKVVVAGLATPAGQVISGHAGVSGGSGALQLNLHPYRTAAAPLAPSSRAVERSSGEPIGTGQVTDTQCELPASADYGGGNEVGGKLGVADRPAGGVEAVGGGSLVRRNRKGVRGEAAAAEEEEMEWDARAHARHLRRTVAVPPAEGSIMPQRTRPRTIERIRTGGHGAARLQRRRVAPNSATPTGASSCCCCCWWWWWWWCGRGMHSRL